MIEIDSYQNDIIRQQISLEAGTYYIEIEYAAREGYISTSQMSLSWNGNKRFIKGQDEEIHIEIITVVAVAGINTIEITGEGPSDGYGMTISRVSLF